MNQLPLFIPQVWSISELTRLIRELVRSEPALQDLWVQGEVSNFTRASSGHLYFTLKDANSALKCVMWRSDAIRNRFFPRDGQAVEAHGVVDIYEAGGVYQLYADLIRPAGEGALYQEFLRLKARLEGEGLFAPERKRPTPAFPKRIGIVTSPTGAALRDILKTLHRRFPIVEVVLAPTPVQGEEAPAGIIAAIQALNRVAQPDVILLARGGGSIEDLWAFNDERVARAIAASPTPVITGIGHETDFTIADFVSDLRAPTPTAAAELATPNIIELQTQIIDLSQRLVRTYCLKLHTLRLRLEKVTHHLRLRSPYFRVLSDRQRLDELSHRIDRAFEADFQLRRARLDTLVQQLAALNPLAVLQRGFSIITNVDGEIIHKISQATPGQEINVRVSDGRFSAEILEQKEQRL